VEIQFWSLRGLFSLFGERQARSSTVVSEQATNGCLVSVQAVFVPSLDQVSSFMPERFQIFTTSVDEAAVRSSRTRVAGSSPLGARSRGRRGSSNLRPGKETGHLASGVGNQQYASISSLGLQPELPQSTRIDASKPRPASTSIRQQQILSLPKAPTKNLGLFGSRSASTSERALGQFRVPGSAKKLAKTAHLHPVTPAGREENTRREAKSKDREVLKNVNSDSEGVGRVPFPSSHGHNTPGEPDTDSAWVDDTDVEGSVGSPYIEKHDQDVWLRQSNGFLSPFELTPPPKPQRRRTSKPAEALTPDIRRASLNLVLQEKNLI
jgi:hypothetical protein